jgi:hypothetical protein
MTDAASRLGHLDAWALLALWASLGTTAVAAQEPPPNPGERIRVELSPTAPPGLPSQWEGVFVTVRQNNIVASNPYYGGVAVPLNAVQSLSVERSRPRSYSWVRGVVSGGAFGIGMWRFLRVLCRKGCDGGLGSAWLPAAASGLGVAMLVSGQGPGTHWVRAGLPVPEPEAGPGPLGVSFSLSLPRDRR